MQHLDYFLSTEMNILHLQKNVNFVFKLYLKNNL